MVGALLCVLLMLIAPFAGLFDLYAINPRCHSSPPLAFFTGAEEHRALAYVGALNQTKHHSDSLSEIWDSKCIWVRKGLIFMEQGIFGTLIWVQKIQNAESALRK
jgi:hypothetical protein